MTIHPTTYRCGGTHLGCDSVEELGSAAVRVAAERAAFGGEAGRRRVIRTLGAGVVAAAMDQAFPILRAQDAMAQAVAQPVAEPEKKDLNVGFIAITCATPIINGGADELLCSQWPERGGRAHRRLGGYSRQIVQRRIRRGAYAEPDAAGYLDGRRIEPEAGLEAPDGGTILDFLVTRSRTLAGARPGGWDGWHVPEVRPTAFIIEETIS